jgi:drug/metabolite transporter (DMT)-like permease
MSGGVLLALASALVWGSGDYCGGRAARRLDTFQVLALSAVSGITVLTVAALVVGEPLPTATSIMWASAAGLAGAAGIVSLYRGLAVGRAATVAPLAAVIAALLPVLFTAVNEGIPHVFQLAGFALALIGIWLVARAAPDSGGSRAGAGHGLAAGFGFGGFLILIALVEPELVYVPLAVARLVMLVTGLAAIAARRLTVPAPLSHPVALLAGTLDAGGNILYLLARQQVRLDIAAVLSSLYPVATVLLARVVSHEPVTRVQWAGALVCLAAVVLITL